jgi:hypothetical protein
MEVKPTYDDTDWYSDGVVFYNPPSTLKYIRVAIKSGSREVLTFHAVRPEPPNIEEAENFFQVNLSPLEQLLADAEVGRKVRESGLELK